MTTAQYGLQNKFPDAMIWAIICRSYGGVFMRCFGSARGGGLHIRKRKAGMPGDANTKPANSNSNSNSNSSNNSTRSNNRTQESRLNVVQGILMHGCCI